MSVPLMTHWSFSSIALTQEAKNLGLQVEIISKEKNFFSIKSEGKKVLFKSTDFGENSSLGLKITNDKELTYKVLERENFPIAPTHYVSSHQIETLEELSLIFPVVIKPLEEAHGNGVMMNISDITELKNKLTESFENYDKMIVQKQIEGDEHRIIIFRGKVIAAITRIPAHVIGDGKHSIEKLICIENSTNRGIGHGGKKNISEIIIDNELYNFLEKKEISLNFIPKLNEYIQLRGNSNSSSGGTSVDIFNKLSGDIKSICINSAKALQLDIAGIDIISTDCTKTLTETNGIILEINSTPGIGSFENNSVANTILQGLFFK